MSQRVENVISQQGNDLSDLINRYAEIEQCPAVGLLAGLISESNLNEHAERIGTWPDWSEGLGQQTLLYAPIGDHTPSAANLKLVKDYYWHPENAIKEAAALYGAYYQQYGDHFEAWSRYNGGPTMAWANNPNKANIRRGWNAAQLYLATDEEPAVPNLTEPWIAAMQALTGTPYVFGGKNIARDGGLDCSGLLTSTARQVGLDLGDPDFTSADGLKAYCDRLVGGDEIQRGDILLFSRTYGAGGPDYATHVGVWLRPEVMLDTHDGVHETDFSTAYWQQHLMGFWRPRGLAGGGEHGGDDLSQAERAELEQYRRDQPYYDTVLGSKDQPGGLIGQAIGTMETAAGSEQSPLADVVRGQCAAIHEAAGI